MKFPGRILVADHSGNLDRFVCRILGQDKWYIASADNIYDLEKAVYSEVPHILVLNAHMPGLRLQGFIDQLKSHYGDNRPHIILAVIKDAEKSLKKGFAAGADDFLRVPFHAVELAAKINCAMRSVYLRYDYQRLTEEYNDQMTNFAPHLYPSQQPVSSSELHGAVLPTPSTENLTPQNSAGSSDIKLRKREFPDPEHDMEPTTVMPQSLPGLIHQSGVEIPEAKMMPPPPPHQSELAPPPAPPENVIPIFQTAQVPQINLDVTRDEATSEGSSRRKMTLMLVKINGFGTVCEDLEAGTSAKVIHNVYQELVREISRFGGKAINIQGDSLLATFTSSRAHQNHRMCAMQAALQLQIKAMFLDEKFPDLVGHISLSIAIHTGMVTTASVGNQSGDTSVMGSTVTVVLRMLDQCEDSQILVSQATYGAFRAAVLVNDERTFEIGRQSQSFTLATLNGLNTRDQALIGNLSFG